jgi:amino acid adenylation domain-containing protein
MDLSDPRVLKDSPPLQVDPSPPASVATLPELFRHQAKQHPDLVAFSCSTGGGLKQLTYGEADRIATALAVRIAHQLPKRGPSDAAPIIALWLERGLDFVLSILATTYAGATWTPFDPDIKTQRAATIIGDASATAIITDAGHLQDAREVQSLAAPEREAAGRSSLQIWTFADLSKATTKSNWFHKKRKSPPSGPRPQDAAYIIYSSGTTGTPKGIAIPHSAALIFSHSERQVLKTSSTDIVWNGINPAFDMYVEEMWVTIAGTGHLAVATREEADNHIDLPDVWKDRGVTLVNAVPSLIATMQDSDGRIRLPPSIRLVNVGGEACPPGLVERLAREGLRIVNTYGPTEATVTATWDELRPDAPVTIGRPLPSYHALLLRIPDEDSPAAGIEPLELAEGVEGELAVGGPCVGLGYVNRAELTAQKFIPHPLAPASGERLYRTGDRVKLQADGKILYIGRIDTQVKLRGFRIELGEIESQLSSHPDVQTAAVILANPNTQTARLEAFVVVRPGAPRDAAPIRELISQRLPTYMVPQQMYFLDTGEMPRLSSGKINSKALHDISKRRAQERAPPADEKALEVANADPESPLGMLLEELRLMYPGVRIGPEINLADLGADSIMSVSLLKKLQKKKSAIDGSKPFAAVGLRLFFDAHTVAKIAACATPPNSSGSSAFGDDAEAADGAFGPEEKFWSISNTRYVLCALAQLIWMLPMFGVLAIEILVPYLLFDFLERIGYLGWAFLAAYGVFVAVPVGQTLLAILVKWMVLGKAKEGEYPLYGQYYFRWWVAERMASFSNPKFVAESPLYPVFLRAMGARVGKYCHLGAMSIGAACDLVEIGDDVVTGAEVVLGTAMVGRGKLVLKKVVIGDCASIGSDSIIEGGAAVEEGAQVGAHTMVPDGMRVPSCQRYHGSPAQFQRHVRDEDAFAARGARPSRYRFAAMMVGFTFIVTLVIPLAYLVPQIPGLLLFTIVDFKNIGAWSTIAVLAVPVAFAYTILVALQLIVARWICVGRLKEGRVKIYSSFYLRLWVIQRLMDLALDVLHPLFATLYVGPFLRALGVKMGKRAEVSTARGVAFELLEIGDESFVADYVILGDEEIRGNELILKKTKLENRGKFPFRCEIAKDIRR